MNSNETIDLPPWAPLPRRRRLGAWALWVSVAVWLLVMVLIVGGFLVQSYLGGLASPAGGCGGG
jgi:hypothetical protein